MASPSAWTARGAAWTTSSSNDCGAASNTKRSTSMPMRRWPRRKPALAPGSASTMMSVSTRASAIAHRDEFTRKACGYVDDRREQAAATAKGLVENGKGIRLTKLQLDALVNGLVHIALA